MKVNSLISIIIPIYNTELYLKRCIDSIIVQTYKNVEILLVDDGSTDRSPQILQGYSQMYNNVYYYRTKNYGSAHARNFALEKAKGDFVVLIDSDDYIHPQFLETLIRVQTETDADIVECAFKKVRHHIKEFSSINNVPEKLVFTNYEKLERFCLNKTYLQTVVMCNKLYKKELFDDIKYIEGKFVDDEYIIHKLIYSSKLVAEVPVCLYYYFMSKESQTRSVPNIRFLDIIDAIKDQLDFFEFLSFTDLYNILLVRYCHTVIKAHYTLIKYFPDDKENKKLIKTKILSIRKNIGKYNIPFEKKLRICLKSYYPFGFWFICMVEAIWKFITQRPGNNR